MTQIKFTALSVGRSTSDTYFWNGREFSTTPTWVKGNSQQELANAQEYIKQPESGIGEWWAEKLEVAVK